MTRPLSMELREKCKRELNERHERLQEDLQHIQEWIRKEPYLNARTDEQLLISFLRGCKFSLQRTKEKIKQMYIMRSLAPEFYCDRDPFLPEIQEALEDLPVVVLRKRATSTAPHVIVVRSDNLDKFRLITVSKVLLMMLDILLWEDESFVICGQHGVINSNGVTLNAVMQVTPTFLKNAITLMERAYPVRVKGLHVLNAPPMFVKVFNFGKSFFSRKLQNRFHFYEAKNMEDLYKEIPKSILPPEFGGDGESFSKLNAYWKEKLESYRDWFLEDSKYCANVKQLGYDSLEMEDSFRMLDID